ncbi:MAG: hypothetical protein K0U34_06045 [Alphaproteobacteria bacterium]|nr:hypothetical protein [Alphaproteobacteria bacterium]
MSIEIGAFQILTVLALCVGGAFAFWNLRSFLRLRRVVYRPRLSGRGKQGDSRRAERALMQKTFVQFLLWSIGTLVFIVTLLPRLVQI